jgi:hypothetical protein
VNRSERDRPESGVQSDTAGGGSSRFLPKLRRAVTTKRLAVALALVVLTLAVLSFVLPYVGSGSGGISPIP